MYILICGIEDDIERRMREYVKEVEASLGNSNTFDANVGTQADSSIQTENKEEGETKNSNAQEENKIDSDVFRYYYLCKINNLGLLNQLILE